MITKVELPVWFRTINLVDENLTAVFTTVFLEDELEVARHTVNTLYAFSQISELLPSLGVDSPEAVYIQAKINQ